MSITSRLSRDAEVRLIMLANSKRVLNPTGPMYRHIHEDDFDRHMRGEQGCRIDYNYAGHNSSLALAEDRVIVEIEGIPVYDTAPPPDGDTI